MRITGVRAVAAASGAAVVPCLVVPCLVVPCLVALHCTASAVAPAGDPVAAPTAPAVTAASSSSTRSPTRSSAPAKPAAPVLAVELAGTEVLTRVLNPPAKVPVTYRLSDYGDGAAGGLIAVSLAGDFHFLAGPERTRTYTYTVQAVSTTGLLSAPGVTNVFTSGTSGTYQTSFAMASESVTAFAQAGDAYVASLSGTCSGDTAYSSASKRLNDSASRAEKVRAADPAMLARWSRAFTGSDISTKGCAQASSIAEFVAREVDTFLTGKRNSWVTVRSNWTTTKGKSACYLRLVSGGARGRTGAPWTRDVLTVVRTQAGCRTLPQPWF